MSTSSSHFLFLVISLRIGEHVFVTVGGISDFAKQKFGQQKDRRSRCNSVVVAPNEVAFSASHFPK